MPDETTSTYGELIKGVGQKFGPYAYRSRGAQASPGLTEKGQKNGRIGQVRFSKRSR